MATLAQLRDALLKPNDLLAGFGVEALLARQPRPRRGRATPAPRQQPPLGIGLEYAKALTAAVNRLEAMVRRRLLPMLRADGQRMDAPPAADGEALARALDEIEVEWWDAEGPRLKQTAARVAARVSVQQRRELGKQLEAVAAKRPSARAGEAQRAALRSQLLGPAGQDVTTALRQRPSARAGQPAYVPQVRAMLGRFQTENVALIQSIPSQSLGQVRDVLTKGLAEGKTVEALARDIEDRFDVTRSRANLIARDQTLTLAAQLNQERMKAAGVGEYTWRVSGSPLGDGRVRPDHLALEGTRHRLNNPPITDRRTGRRGHPGTDINCRCEAEPVLADDETWRLWWNGQEG
jgi:SPP1 gp7 family putative phage head morphogenesis protein